jgi:hypothetical protein
MMKMASPTMSSYSIPRYVAPMRSAIPRVTPPKIAPTVEPSPPRIVMMKAFVVKGPPMSGNM